MKVLKFGGTSVGSPKNMRAVIDLITNGEQKIVVLSAMSGTTNSLVEIADYLYKKNKDTARIFIGELESKYKKVVDELFTENSNKKDGLQIIGESFTTIKSFTSRKFGKVGENTILAQGELISTQLFALLMKENGFNVKLLPALDFIRTGGFDQTDQQLVDGINFGGDDTAGAHIIRHAEDGTGQSGFAFSEVQFGDGDRGFGRQQI